MSTNKTISKAVETLKQGGVIAYPTEYCFGLGCDPKNSTAINRILKIKQRSADHGLILLAATLAQVEEYAQWSDLELKNKIESSWPGPITWLLPAKAETSKWIRGIHSTVAMRVTAHEVSRQICTQFNGAIVSTSANRHGEPSKTVASDVITDLGKEVDFVIDLAVGDDSGSMSASKIFNGLTGEQLR